MLPAFPSTASTVKARQVATALNLGLGPLAALPDRSLLAFLFRGQVFRKGGRRGRGYSKDHVADQLRITQSVVDNIILPRERASHIVDAYLAEGSGFHLLGRIGGSIGKRCVRMQRSFTYTNQGLSMRGALKEFGSRVPDPAVYRAVIVTRFDITLKSFIYELPTVKSDAFNFISHCEDSPKLAAARFPASILSSACATSFTSCLDRTFRHSKTPLAVVSISPTEVVEGTRLLQPDS